MSREQIGKEFQADSTRIKKLYKEAVGEEIDPITGEIVGVHVKFTRFVTALSKRLNPTRRLVVGSSALGFLAHFFTTGLFSNGMLIFSFMGFMIVMILELLEKFDAMKEIDFARDIQLSLLPEPKADTETLDIASFANTANDVGGDYIDVIKGEHGTFVVIADVSGKGLQAALYMVRMQAMVHLLINKGIESPRKLFLELNDFIKSGKRDKTFVTACAAFFPKNESHFVFTRAGHNPPILYQYEKDQTFSLRTPGLALGMAPTSRLEKHLKESKIAFHPNDSVLFYTDGLTEARDLDGREYGEHRIESIMDIYGALDAETILEKIEGSLGAFINDQEQFDDITFTVIHHKGKSEKI